MDLAQVRVAVMGTLWARSQGGVVVASNDHPSALDDLEWLGIEPDAMVSAPRAERYRDACTQLIDRGTAYGCYCTMAEMREMPPNIGNLIEPVRYDGRCRRLSSRDRDTLTSAGRSPSVRLVRGDTTATFTTEDGRAWSTLPEFDFQLVRSDGQATTAFGLAVDTHTADGTHVVVDEDTAPELARWALIAERYGWELPQVAVLPPWRGPLASVTVSELRDAGYLPSAVLKFMLNTGWDSKGSSDLAALVSTFRLSDLFAVEGPVLLDHLREANGVVLRSIDEDERLAAVVEYLTRRGYSIAGFEPAWQRRFVSAILSDLRILSDVEELASLLLTATVDYDREVARVLRQADTQALIDDFEASFAELESDDDAAWRETLQVFRATSAAPGRALATLRMVLTGTRTGPNLASFLALLGRERCRGRLQKARRYTATKG